MTPSVRICALLAAVAAALVLDGCMTRPPAPVDERQDDEQQPDVEAARRIGEDGDAEEAAAGPEPGSPRSLLEAAGQAEQRPGESGDLADHLEADAAFDDQPRRETGDDQGEQRRRAAARCAPGEEGQRGHRGEAAQGGREPDRRRRQRQEPGERRQEVDVDGVLVFVERLEVQRHDAAVLVDAVMGDGPGVVAHARLVVMEAGRDDVEGGEAEGCDHHGRDRERHPPGMGAEQGREAGEPALRDEPDLELQGGGRRRRHLSAGNLD